MYRFSRRTSSKQPQQVPRISRTNALSRNIRALFIGGSGREIVNGLEFTKNGSPTVSANINGVVSSGSATGSGYDGFYAPQQSSGSQSSALYDPLAPPITLFIVGNSLSGVNSGSGIGRCNGSGLASFALFFWDGSVKGAGAYVRTSGGTLVIYPGEVFSTLTGKNVAVLSIGVSETNLYTNRIAKSTFTTPSGNFYYEYNDIYRCLSFLGGYTFGGGSIALAGMVVGEAWDDAKALNFIDNPWQIFEPQPMTWFSPSASAPQLLAPTGQLAGSTWLASNGGALYTCVDETVADEADYTYTTTSGAWEEFTFPNGGSVSAAGGFVRYNIPAGSGAITVELRQGASVLETWGPHTLTGSLQTFAQPITASTSDSNDLRVRFTAS